MTRQVSLSVNGASIPVDYFVQAFIDHTLGGMVESLEGTGPVKTLNLTINGDKVVINLNGVVVPTNVFASKIIRATTIGLVSTLKGVSEVKKLEISIMR